MITFLLCTIGIAILLALVGFLGIAGFLVAIGFKILIALGLVYLGIKLIKAAFDVL